MIIQKFFSKILADFRQINTYPSCQYGDEWEVDYKKYWAKRRGGVAPVFSDWQKQRANIVLKIMKEDSMVVDLGCGDGAVLKYLKDKKNIKGIGVDINVEMLQKTASLGIATLQLDLNDLKSLQNLPEVDYILGFEIIEHMPNPEKMIFYLLNKARKGLIFSMPNTGYYAHRLRLLFGAFPLQWVVHPGEHLRFWTKRDMKFWVSSMGLKINGLFMYEGLPGLNKLWPSLFSKGMVVFISK